MSSGSILLLFSLVLSSWAFEDWQSETGLADPPPALDESVWNTEITFLGFPVKVSVPFSRPELAPDIVIGCLSAPNNQDMRDAIRDTWARTHERDHRTILVWFLLGTPETPELLEEAKQHNDMFFVNVHDSYRYGLTPKVQVYFSIAADLFPNAPWFMKTDDDAFLLLDPFFERLDEQEDPMQHPIAVGHWLRKETVIRDSKSKWFVSLNEYPSRTYPPYMNGLGVVLSNNLVKCYTPHLPTEDFFFVFEDVYLGILLAKYCNPYTSTDVSSQMIKTTKYNLDEDRGKILVHGIKNHEYFHQMWQENCDSMAFCEPLEHTVAQGEQIAHNTVAENRGCEGEECYSGSPHIFFIASLMVMIILVVRIQRHRKKAPSIHSQGGKGQ